MSKSGMTGHRKAIAARRTRTEQRHLPAVVTMAAVVLSAIGSPAIAELPAALTCSFGDGGAWAFEKGKFASKPVEKLAIVIRDIDRNQMLAKLERAADQGGGGSPLRMVQASDAYHFIEVGVEGFLNLTTVYERPDGQTGETFPAVHSRHVAVLGEPLVSQYRGACQAITEKAGTVNAGTVKVGK